MAMIRRTQAPTVSTPSSTHSNPNYFGKRLSADIQSVHACNLSFKPSPLRPQNARKERLFQALSPAEVQRCLKGNADLAAALEEIENNETSRASLALMVSENYTARRTCS